MKKTKKKINNFENPDENNYYSVSLCLRKKEQKATVCVPVSQTDVVFPSDILSIWLKKYWWHLFLKFVYRYI